MDNPVVSIIVATFNSGRTLRASLQSVLDQTYQSWECIVVDGASKDDTLEIIAEYESLDTRFRHISEPDKGIYDAFNKGWQMARGEWIHYLGSDDRLAEDGIKQLIDNSDQYDVVGGSTYLVYPNNVVRLQESHGVWGCHQSKIVRKAVIAELGGFDMSYPVLSDSDMMFKIERGGYKVANVEAVISYFSMDGLSQSLSKQFDLAAERYRIRKANGVRFPLIKTADRFIRCVGSILRNKLRLQKNIKAACLMVLLSFGYSSFAQQINSSISETYYISSSEGDDRNDGLSADAPKKTVSQISHKKNICVKFKSGDVFYENFDDLKGWAIEPYGEGRRPVICGFKKLEDVSAWTPCGNDIWKIDLSDENKFSGYLAKDHKWTDTINDVGLIYNPQTDVVFGNNVPSYDKLKNDGDFFVSSYFLNADIKKNPFRYLYLKSSVNPQEYGQLCFSIGLNCFRQINDTSIKGIDVVGFARHGVSNGSNNNIYDCRFDLIGGAIQNDFQYWVRYGNGVQFLAVDHDNTVTKCVISRTYDCGATIQGKTKPGVMPRNIHFENNYFYHCRQAFEHFISSTGDYESYYDNCSFSGNICYLMGENEFSSPQIRDANILSYENSSRELTITDNVFYGAPHLDGYNFGPGSKDNVIYIYSGQYLNHYHGLGNYPTIYANSREDIESYMTRTGDSSKIIILEKGTAKDRRIGRRIQKTVNWTPLFLNE